MPGSTPWASASPKKARPRTTTHVPMRAVVVAASSPPSSARCVMLGGEGVGEEVDQLSAPTMSSALVRIISTYVSAPDPGSPRLSVNSSTTSTSPTSSARASARSVGAAPLSAKMAGTPASRMVAAKRVEVGGRRRGVGRRRRDDGADDLEVVAVGEVSEHLVVGDEDPALGRHGSEHVVELGLELGQPGEVGVGLRA